MSPDQSSYDSVLLAELAAVMARAEPAPASVLRQAKDAFAWRDIAAVIASLEYDSLLDDDDLARVRQSHAERTLVFAVPGVTVRMSLLDGGQRIVGQLTPGHFRQVEMRQRNQTVTAELDPLGRFLFDSVAPGSFSVRCSPARATDPVVETEWVTV